MTESICQPVAVPMIRSVDRCVCKVVGGQLTAETFFKTADTQEVVVG